MVETDQPLTVPALDPDRHPDRPAELDDDAVLELTGEGRDALRLIRSSREWARG